MGKKLLSFFKGRRGGVISRLPSGKVVLPVRGWNPQPGEKWQVDIEEKERYAIAKPIAKIVRKQQRSIVRYKCGHETVVSITSIEVPENEPIEDRVEYIPSFCSDCREKLDVDSLNLDSIGDIDTIEEIINIKNERLEKRIIDLENKKLDLKKSVIIMRNLDDRAIECRYCGEKIELRRGTVTCKCGAEYSITVETDIEEGISPMRKTRIHSWWSIKDHHREQEVQKDIKEIDEEIKKLRTEISKNYEYLEERLQEELRKFGVKEVRYDLDNSGCGEVIIVYEDGKEIKGEIDEGLILNLSGEITRILEKLPVKNYVL